MNPVVISIAIAFILALGLVVSLAALNLLTGSAYFFLGKPKVKILKSEKGKNGFAFGFSWNSSREPASLDTLQLRLFNPFGSPTQVETSEKFPAKKSNFALDLDFGPAMADFLQARGFENALVQIQVSSSKEGIFFQFEKRGDQFLEELNHAMGSVEDFEAKHGEKKSKIYYANNSARSFVAEPMAVGGGNALKIASNPAFAGEFAGEESSESEEKVENFSVSKVWIEPGCIVCNACEAIFPEVFEVTEDTCLIRPDYPQDNGLLVLEAAEACPVEVIKFEKSS